MKLVTYEIESSAPTERMYCALLTEETAKTMSALPLSLEGERVWTPDGRSVHVKETHFRSTPRRQVYSPVVNVTVYDISDQQFFVHVPKIREETTNVSLFPSKHHYTAVLTISSGFEPLIMETMPVLSLEETVQGIPFSEFQGNATCVDTVKLSIQNGFLMYCDKPIAFLGLEYNDYSFISLCLKSFIPKDSGWFPCFEKDEAQ